MAVQHQRDVCRTGSSRQPKLPGDIAAQRRDCQRQWTRYSKNGAGILYPSGSTVISLREKTFTSSSSRQMRKSIPAIACARDLRFDPAPRSRSSRQRPDARSPIPMKNPRPIAIVPNCDRDMPTQREAHRRGHPKNMTLYREARNCEPSNRSLAHRDCQSSRADLSAASIECRRLAIASAVRQPDAIGQPEK